ncbi:putative ribosomal protein L18 [Helianthus debilis subsp. tardiflorus]
MMVTVVVGILTKGKRCQNPNKHISFEKCMMAYRMFSSQNGSFTHPVTIKQVAVAGANSKDIKSALKSRLDILAWLVIRRILSKRARKSGV